MNWDRFWEGQSLVSDLFYKTCVLLLCTILFLQVDGSLNIFMKVSLIGLFLLEVGIAYYRANKKEKEMQR